MKKVEALGIIVMSYSWARPIEKGTETIDEKGRPIADVMFMSHAHEMMERKGYFFKRNHPLHGLPTRKTFKLLAVYGVTLKTLQKRQAEFKEKGFVTYTDKMGKEWKV